MIKQITAMGMFFLYMICDHGNEVGLPVGENTYETQVETVEENMLIDVNDRESLREILEESIEQCVQPPLMDMEDFSLEYGLETDVKNVFFELMSMRCDLQYAYEFTTEVNEQGLLNCKIDYMPYRTGNYPEGFEGIEVGSLTELIQAARTHLADDSVNIRITNSELLVEDMNAVLMNQVGQTYILSSLNKDGTQILMKPATILRGEPINNKEEALQKLSRIDELAQQVVDEYTNETMSQMEKAQALYAYLTENVVYDYRYYNDFENFDDKARTALGALEDHLAICGGYAQALQILFEKVGIPCYVESGDAGEEHLWAIAKINDTWNLFDATFDAGKKQDEWKYFNVDIAETTSHKPNKDVINKLIEEETLS